nr:MAG TPA_asm: hypothetical protein [Bacteriophage sp.]
MNLPGFIFLEKGQKTQYHPPRRPRKLAQDRRPIYPRRATPGSTLESMGEKWSEEVASSEDGVAVV